MKIQKIILTSKFNELLIESEDPVIIEHFSKGNNYTDIILHQINNERMYDFVFRGREDAIILDLGANIGLFSLYAHDSAKKIYAFEPTPAHFNILSALAKDLPNIVCLPVALHNEDKDVDFYISDDNSTMNSTTNVYGKKIKVIGQKLKTILETNNIDHVDVVKCDIEGSEMTAITVETLGEVADKIDSWFVEVHATGNGGVLDNRARLVKIFKEVGYEVEIFKWDGFYAKKMPK